MLFAEDLYEDYAPAVAPGAAVMPVAEEEEDVAYLGFAALAMFLGAGAATGGDFFLFPSEETSFADGTSAATAIPLDDEDMTYAGFELLAKALMTAKRREGPPHSPSPFFVFPEATYDGDVRSSTPPVDEDMAYLGFRALAEAMGFGESEPRDAFLYPDAYDGPLAKKRKTGVEDDHIDEALGLVPYLGLKLLCEALLSSSSWPDDADFFLFPDAETYAPQECFTAGEDDVVYTGLGKLRDATRLPMRALRFLASPFNSQREPKLLKKSLSNDNLTNFSHEDLASLAGTKLWGQKSKRSVRLRNHLL